MCTTIGKILAYILLILSTRLELLHSYYANEIHFGIEFSNLRIPRPKLTPRLKYTFIRWMLLIVFLIDSPVTIRTVFSIFIGYFFSVNAIRVEITIRFYARTYRCPDTSAVHSVLYLAQSSIFSLLPIGVKTGTFTEIIWF